MPSTQPKTELIVLSGPSGAGKSTLIKKLFAEFPNKFGFSVSHTTRKPREGEVNGKDYHFVSKEEFEKLKSQEQFIETAQFSVKNVMDQGRICILDIEMNGVMSLKKANLFKALYISLQPPSIQILESRLRSRGTETEESVQARLKAAAAELEFAKKPGSFDSVIINDDLNVAYDSLKSQLKQINAL